MAMRGFSGKRRRARAKVSGTRAALRKAWTRRAMKKRSSVTPKMK
jgi:hypothetical protein